MNLDDRIYRLEKKVCGAWSPGTSLSRSLVPESILNKENVYPEGGKDYYRTWVLGLGRIGDVLKFFYGLTIEEAIKNAEDFIFNFDASKDIDGLLDGVWCSFQQDGEESD